MSNENKNVILTVTETKRSNSKYHYKVMDVNTKAVIYQHYSNDKFVAVVLDSHKPIYCKTVEVAETYKKKYNLEIAVLKADKQELPEWLFIGTFTTCYSYCDTRIEEKGDYKTILRLFYSPLRIEITEANRRNYPEVLAIAQAELNKFKEMAKAGESLVITGSGQTTGLSLPTGPDVVIVNI